MKIIHPRFEEAVLNILTPKKKDAYLKLKDEYRELYDSEHILDDAMKGTDITITHGDDTHHFKTIGECALFTMTSPVTIAKAWKQKQPVVCDRFPGKPSYRPTGGWMVTIR